MMQEHSTEQYSTADLRRRLTNFKMLVSQSMSAVWTTTFLDFWLSQDSVAT